MPQGENFWNPYRWVTVSSRPVNHDVPNYHHTLSGLSGRLWCELEALTPLLIGNGNDPIEFVRHKHNGQPYIPSTSLKGIIRSLAEVVGNGTVPFSDTVDSEHEPENARRNTAGHSQLDTISRIFGYLRQGDSSVFTGLLHFSDAEISIEVSPPDSWQQYTVVVGQPRTSHGAFYPTRISRNQRKFYHHHPGATELTPAPHNIQQVKNVTPAPPGTCFKFTVDFTNLRDAELDLLLYCLVLEEDVTVTLSPAALGRDQTEPPFTFTAPLRHKMGGAKPHGGGSVHIRITKLQLCQDAAARYRGNCATQTFESTALKAELNTRTGFFCGRTDQTMRELRAMLIYSTDDPRCPIHYPRYRWFEAERKLSFPQQTRLKPTI